MVLRLSLSVTQEIISGLEAVFATGNVVIFGKANINPDSVSTSVELANVLVYGDIDESQSPSYSEINETQSPSYADIDESQSSGYANIDESQTPNYTDINETQNPAYEEVA